MPVTSTPWPAISEQIWDMKYRLKSADGTPLDRSIADTWAPGGERGGGGRAEAHAQGRWASRFAEAMADFAFLPAGRILAGAGTGRDVTLFNCFVMGRIEDDLGSIFDNVKEAALTMQQGGGIGHDFSTLRPKGALVKSIGADASGPVSFMDVWDAMCRTIMSAGARRGAMMATLRCDHPDIEAFIDAKSDAARLRNFNLSVLVTDAFIRAVRNDEAWNLLFDGKVYRTVAARALWERMMRATYEYAEPGVVFIDRINAANNLAYCEDISCTNPCVPGDTWVHTSDGPRQVHELVGRPFSARVHGQGSRQRCRWLLSHRAASSLCGLRTVEGHTLRLTVDHRVKRVSRLTRQPGTGVGAAGDASSRRPHPPQRSSRADRLGAAISRSSRATSWASSSGDGTLKSDKAVLSVWRPAAVVNGTASSGRRRRDGGSLASSNDAAASGGLQGLVRDRRQKRVSARARAP